MSLVAKRLIACVIVPSTIALAALFHASAMTALLSAAISSVETQPLDVRPSAPPSSLERPSASAVLARNAFDHETGPLRSTASDPEPPVRHDDPRSAPSCTGVRALAAIRSHEPDFSFAALEIGQKRVLRRRGDALADGAALKVAYVGEDRVWLEDGSGLCQARVGAPKSAPPPPPLKGEPPKRDALEKKLEGKIVKIGANEWRIDRGAVDQLLEAQAELMRVPLVPEKEGDRVVGLRLAKVRPGSAIAMLGLEENDRLVSVNGIDVTTPERVFEAYARLKAGAIDRITIHVVRNGKPTNLDYVIR